MERLKQSEAKWCVLVDDVVVPMPQRKVKVRVIRAQAGVPDGFVLVRDHNSPYDVVLNDDQEIDLAEGNVLYRLAACDVQPRQECDSPAKLAFFVDDRAEITTNRNQSGQSLRDLFGLAKNVRLVRDLESPDDIGVAPEANLKFEDGPVYYTRQHESKLRITVNSQVFSEDDGVMAEMKGVQIAALVYSDNPTATKIRWSSNGDREVGLEETIHIAACAVFNVTRCTVVAGYEPSRIERELTQLRDGGARVTLSTSPVPAVIYHDVPTRPGYEPSKSDVVVLVPSGYPGAMIDGMFLPVGSSLINRVPGSPQEREVEANGQRWRLISVHPHDPQKGAAWNPTKHGFQTYYGEVLSWLCNAK
jgi:hypothetical protein